MYGSVREGRTDSRVFLTERVNSDRVGYSRYCKLELIVSAFYCMYLHMIMHAGPTPSLILEPMPRVSMCFICVTIILPCLATCNLAALC